MAIARWLKQEYPAIARQARRDKAVIYWGDEMGLRSDHVTGTSYAPVGQTPRYGHRPALRVQHDLGHHEKGALAFMVFQGKFKAHVFVVFLQRLLKQIAG